MTGEVLFLDDGRTVTLGEHTPGGSKNQTTYGLVSDGQEVVVKIETPHGRLDRERAALDFAHRHGVHVPRLVGSGTTAPGPEGRLFLVLNREPGVRTREPEGWCRLGRDLAALARVPIEDCALPVMSPQAFATDHTTRLHLVEHLLGDRATARVRAAIEHLGTAPRLVFTHGDPGSGNYLDTGAGGVILDWEDATVSPFGLDIGRAAFIALMDLTRTGRPVELATAVVRGYQDALDQHGDRVGDDLLTASTIVAGLQFVHGRYVEPLRPDRTPQAAAATLHTYLAAH